MRRPVVLLALTVLFAVAGSAIAATRPEGEAAPAFRLQDQNGHWGTPDDFHGSWLVRYFYSKDFAPGCTTEVRTFRDDIATLRQAGARVVGVSLHGVKSHAEFAQKYHVSFALLADADRQVATSYGVLISRTGQHYATRTTFLINPQGRIAKAYVDVDPEQNSNQALNDLARLKAAR